MPDVANERHKTFVQRLARWPWKQELPGVVALAEGLALLGLFCFAPWVSWRAVLNTLGLHMTPAFERYVQSLAADHSYSGWAVAQGISVATTPFMPVVPLWLVPLVALALLLLGALHLRRSLSHRQMGAALLLLSTLALLVQVALPIQAAQLETPFGATMHIGVSWGFWGAVGVPVAGMVAGVWLLSLLFPRSGALATGGGRAALTAES